MSGLDIRLAIRLDVFQKEYSVNTQIYCTIWTYSDDKLMTQEQHINISNFILNLP